MSALEPAASGGLPALDRALVRLSTHRRLLVIAAHPDDEDTSLLTWVARGLGGEAAYLSLSRGDGGQNLLGPELGEGLGLLRSHELMAAREIDGARQFFSRAYDFGYTRSLDETFERWPKDVLLEDTARVVRRFKPQVLVAVFPPTERAGHGQHQASAVVAGEIFETSGGTSFPQLDGEGLPPWQISMFYRAAWFDPEAATLELPLGTLEPWSGRSILQIALDSRSQHRCQDMGNIQPLGDATGRLTWQAGVGGTEGELFEGIDTSLTAIADLLERGPVRDAVLGPLAEAQRLAVAARAELDAREPEAVAGPLLAIVGQLRSARQAVGDGPEDAALHVAELLDEKLTIAQEAAAVAAQVLADAYTDREAVVLGSTFEARSVFWNAGGYPIGDGLTVEAITEEGWELVSSEPAEVQRSRFATQLTDERVLTVEVGELARPSIPYFFEKPRQGDLFDWSEVSSEVQGEPFQPPPLRLRFRFELDGVPIELEREVVQRLRDQAFGEVRRPLRAVPALEIQAEPSQLVWPTGSGGKTLEVVVASNQEAAVRGRVEIGVPDGWPAVEPRPFSIDDPQGRVALQIEVEPPTDTEAGRHTLAVVAVSDAGQRFDHAYPLVDYEHIRPTPRPMPARVDVTTLDLTLPPLERVGYVRGASDRVPEALSAVGVPIELLDAETLATGDLAVYDAIVVGSRAYEVDPALVRANPRLLDYTREGGLLIVQYQQYQFVRGEHAPYPLEIRRPHDRVTDESAAVRLLQPDHPVFHHPNRLGDEDWQGWVQERGLYFAGTWDDAYAPLLAMADPAGDEKQGALLVATVGKGTYVYTGLAFFRQLPAGVPGATRLLVNLLGL